LAILTKSQTEPENAGHPAPRQPLNRSAVGWVSTDFSAILTNEKAEPENAVSRFLYFRRPLTVENGGTSACRG
jgi:hypothetical protein